MQIFDSLISWVYPPRCVACDKDQSAVLARDAARFEYPEPKVNRFLCADCMFSIGEWTPSCPSCRAPSDGGYLCGSCLEAQPSFPVSRLIAYGNYDDRKLAVAIKALKFRRLTKVAEPLGELLGERFREQIAMSDVTKRRVVLTPVPLSALRQRWRGFFQAQLLAENVGRELALPVELLARRIVHTAPQTKLTEEARKLNVANSFASITSDRYDLVVIVDDVWTTGSTTCAVAGCLREQCNEIWSLVLAA